MTGPQVYLNKTKEMVNHLKILRVISALDTHSGTGLSSLEDSMGLHCLKEISKNCLKHGGVKAANPNYLMPDFEGYRVLTAKTF